MIKQSLSLFCVLAALSACGGRSPADLQRTLGYIPQVDAQGQMVMDLATQNRINMQKNTPFSYIYTVPETETSEEASSEIPETSDSELPIAPDFTLENLAGMQEHIAFPRSRVMILAIADPQGSEDMENWLTPLQDRYPYSVDFYSLIELSSVSTGDRANARNIVKQTQVVDTPLLFDWTGRVSKAFNAEAQMTNVYAINGKGEIIAEGRGAADLEKLKAFADIVDQTVN